MDLVLNHILRRLRLELVAAAFGACRCDVWSWPQLREEEEEGEDLAINILNGLGVRVRLIYLQVVVHNRKDSYHQIVLERGEHDQQTAATAILA